MDNPNSPLDTLRQLKEMLDAGALTPTEFEALKQRLVFSPPPATPPAPEPSAPAASATPLPLGSAPPAAGPPLPLLEQLSANEFRPNAPAGFAQPSSVEDAAGTEPAYAAAPAVPAWQTADEFPAAPEAPARNPLALILSIGGVLVFLAVVLYLNLNRPPSEHLSSTSQTAADSLAAPIETGPQAEPLPITTAAPETVRVAPAHPAPVIQTRPAPAARDSAELAPPPPATDSAARQ